MAKRKAAGESSEEVSSSTEENAPSSPEGAESAPKSEPEVHYDAPDSEPRIHLAKASRGEIHWSHEISLCGKVRVKQVVAEPSECHDCARLRALEPRLEEPYEYVSAVAT